MSGETGSQAICYYRPANCWTTTSFVRYNRIMTRTITAIFDAGVFRPLEPVGLADGTQVELKLQMPSIPTAEIGDATKKTG